MIWFKTGFNILTVESGGWLLQYECGGWLLQYITPTIESGGTDKFRLVQFLYDSWSVGGY